MDGPQAATQRSSSPASTVIPSFSSSAVYLATRSSRLFMVVTLPFVRRGCAQGQVSARGPQVKRKPPAILRIHGLAAYLGTVPRRRSPMIPRYARPEMTAIWSPETKFRIWYEIEAHACDAQAELGVIPRENAEAV